MANGDVTRVSHLRYLRNLPVAADAVIRRGDLVLATNAGGICKPGQAVGSCKGVGIAQQDVDNTGGADGDKTTDVEQGVFLLSNSGTNTIAIADVGKKGTAYAEGVATVGNDSTGKSPVGAIVGLGWQNLAGVQVEIRS